MEGELAGGGGSASAEAGNQQHTGKNKRRAWATGMSSIADSGFDG